VVACGDVRTFIKRWVHEDATRTVVLSTHDMREADDLCDRVAILDAGRLLACETPAALRRRLDSEPTFRLETSALADEHAVALTGVAGVRKVTHRGSGARSMVDIVLHHDEALRPVLTTLSALRVELIGLTRRVTTLEEAFLVIVGAREPGALSRSSEWALS
jgi:ABC-2 type transport system ATP-binding protein